MVFNTDLRHPAVLARELASIDIVSGGRLEVGLGAGYNPLDYSRSGIAMDPPKVRVDRLIEHTMVLKALWSEHPTTFEGDHYRIDDLDGTPKPLTPGGPPVLVAGGGRRMMRFAAQHADIVGVNVHLPSSPDAASARDALPDSIDEKFGWIRADSGDRFDDLEFNAWLSVGRVTNDMSRMSDRLSAAFGAPAAEVLESPLVLAGTVERIVDQLEQRRARWGYSYFVLPQPATGDFAPIIARMTGT
jgi:probable F420-dependent oxidoreductase